jgi:hypothetical protein
MVRSANNIASMNPVEKNQPTGFRIFPNPTDHILTIQSDIIITMVEIRNPLGQEITKIYNTNKINISALPTGQYVLTVYNQNSQPVGRTIFLKN